MNTTLVSVLSGLGGMFGWGVSDFFANSASDQIGHTKTLFYSQIAGLILVGLVMLFLKPVFDFSGTIWFWVILASLGYTAGYLFYYKAMTVGNLSVVSVIINLNAIFTMMVAYFAYGQRLSGLKIPGVSLVILGVMLLSVDFKELINKGKDIFVKGFKESLFASIGFGFIGWPITEYVVERANWMWMALVEKIITLALIFIVIHIGKGLRNKTSLDKGIVKTTILVGILDALAILSVNYGMMIGDSILISPIANSVAIVTVAMAVIFLKEKISNIQAVGIAMTIGGIVMSAF